MSWAPKDLEDELFDDFSNCTLQEPPSYFKPVTEKHIPIIIKKIDVVKESKDEKLEEVSNTVAEMSLTQSLRMYGIESSDDIPKSSSLSACIIKNDFSDPKHPLILEERYFTMKSDQHPCTSNQANKTRALPKKSVCDQQLYESSEKTAKTVLEDQRPRSPKPSEEVPCHAVSKLPIFKSRKSSKNRTKMKQFDLTPQESPQKFNRMAPPGVRGICFI